MVRRKRNPKAVALAEEILKQYDPQSTEDVDDALNDIFGSLFESMLHGEIKKQPIEGMGTLLKP